MSGTILVVCTANVCRSPLAARVLQTALADSPIGAVAVSSAGTRALVGEAMCPVSADELDEGDQVWAGNHLARQLSGDLVREADLVLTMEREQRSFVVRAAPGSQTRAFTIQEAVALLGVLAARGAEAPSDLPGLASALHSMRGLVPLAPLQPVKKHWWSRAAEPMDPMTIADGHGRSFEDHMRAAKLVRATAERFAAGVIGLNGLTES